MKQAVTFCATAVLFIYATYTIVSRIIMKTNGNRYEKTAEVMKNAANNFFGCMIVTNGLTDAWGRSIICGYTNGVLKFTSMGADVDDTSDDINLRATEESRAFDIWYMYNGKFTGFGMSED